MSEIYQKPTAGRKTNLEKNAERAIREILSKNDIDSSTIEMTNSPDELYKLRDSLTKKYGTPEITPEALLEDAPVKKVTPTKEAPPEEEFVEPVETSPTTEIKPSSEFYELADFEEAKTEHPFYDEFREEDLFKANDFLDPEKDSAAENIDEPELLETEEIPVQNDAAPNAWENRKGNRDRSDAMKRVQEEPDTTETPSVDSNPEDAEKVKLAEKTSKIATKSLAKQSAKLFEFATEFAVKKYAKVSERKLDGMEEKGVIDRSFILPNGQTVAELIETHNEVIDELVSTDDETREELVEALMLVAQKHQIQVSPESNLAMVVITMLIGLAKAGHDQKKIMDRTLRKISDSYVMQKRTLVESEARAVKAEERLANIESNNQAVTPPAPTPPEEEQIPAGVRTLSFTNPSKETPAKKSLTIVKNDFERDTNFSEAESELEEINSEVEGDSRINKPVVVKKPSGGAPVKKITTNKKK